eukprot:30943-Pelagococcus_subviridis.AAC.9
MDVAAARVDPRRRHRVRLLRRHRDARRVGAKRLVVQPVLLREDAVELRERDAVQPERRPHALLREFVDVHERDAAAVPRRRGVREEEPMRDRLPRRPALGRGRIGRPRHVRGHARDSPPLEVAVEPLEEDVRAEARVPDVGTRGGVVVR